jgi:BirA family biotin operon repressor/biotin-[acetyl-CoA-carboxylase] ligase
MIKFSIGKYDCLNSTNLYLQNLCELQKCEEGDVILANQQHEGKGYGENRWESEAGKNLLFSLCLKPDFLSANQQFIISMMVCLSITKSISRLIPTDQLTIKWPNDIYFNNKKLGGVLIENSISGQNISKSIVGIGLNVNQTIFSKSIPNPISLKQINKIEIDRDILLEQILFEISFYYSELKKKQFDSIRTAYLNQLYRFGVESHFSKNKTFFSGKIIGINKYGQLKIETQMGLEEFGFKEIEYII